MRLIVARPERNDVDYFPHPVKHGKKMFYIEQKYKNDGYAAWHKILEELGDTDYHYLDLSSKAQIMYLSARCIVPEETLLNIINDLVNLGEFNSYLWDEFKILWNQSFINSVEDAYKKRNNKCITIEGLVDLLQVKVDPKLFKCSLNCNGNPQRIVKDSKVKETKEKKTSLSSKHDIPYEEIINDLNLKANTNYKHSTQKTRDNIKTRMKEGFTLEDFKTVHSKKVNEWLNTDMSKFLRPETLYSNKFEGYLNQLEKDNRVSDVTRQNMINAKNVIARMEAKENAE